MKKFVGNNHSMLQAVSEMNSMGAAHQPFLFIIDFEMQQPLLFQLPLANENILFSIRGFTNSRYSKILNKEVIFSKHPVDFNHYKIAFDKVMNEIHKGNSYLVNLTQPSFININLSLQEIFYYSEAKYKLCFKNEFVVFSPETFIKIENNFIKAYPMKGTINAEIPKAETIILNDNKEKAEHMTIVDLIRNDVSIFAKKVYVKRLRYLDYLVTNQKNLWQVSSEICGELPINYVEDIGNIIFSMLPAGSVSGAPKQKTVQIIKDAENYNRGYYTGVFGYFDGKKLDSAVMIRFIENKEGKFIYKSGGGITALSDAQTEYEELINKIYVPLNRNN